MSFTHFNNQLLDPIYNDRFSIDFIGEDESLSFFCYKITKKHFHFHLNEINKSIVPLYTLNEIIDKKRILNVSVELYNKLGEVLTIIYLEDVTLLKIKYLLKLDYSTTSLLDIKVEYQYNRMKICKDKLQLKKYQRRQKLERINDTTAN